jgi:hypothetical protein
LSGEFNQNLSHEEENQWVRYTLDGRTLLLHGGRRYVFVPHLLLDGVVGDRLQSLLTGRSQNQGDPVSMNGRC